MKALILAAGAGKRLRPLTEEKPKCLVSICGIPILKFQLDALNKLGIDDVTIVIGYKAEKVKEILDNKYNMVINNNYESTSSLYSMLLAEEQFRGKDFILINGDIVFNYKLIAKLLQFNAKTAALIDKNIELVDGEMNVVIENGVITGFNKSIKAKDADAQSLQLVKIGASDSELLFTRASILEKEGGTQLFPAYAFDVIFEKSVMLPIQRNDGLWAEIDTLDDIKYCEMLINNSYEISISN